MKSTATKTVQIISQQTAPQRLRAEPGQALSLIIDGVPYTGQKHIKGKPVQLVRKGNALQVLIDDPSQPALEIEDFFAAATADGQATALGTDDVLALMHEGSAVQVAAASPVDMTLPQWGTLVAQAPAVTGVSAGATTAAVEPVLATAGSTGGGLFALLGGLGLAAVASNGSKGASAPADSTPPTVEITDNVAGTANGPVTYTITFSEAVSGFDASKVSTNAGTLSGFTANADGKTFTVVLTPPANASGNAQLSVSTSGVADAAGNAAVAPAVAVQAFDTIAPTATVSDNVAGTANGPVTYTITFSEAVSGFNASKVSTNAGTLSGFTANSDGKTFTIVLTPPANASGTAQLTVSTSGVADAAGNAAVAPAVANQAYVTASILDGSVTLGPVIAGNSLTVKAFDLDGNELGQSAVSSSGYYNINLGAYTGGVVLKLIDASANDTPDYRDEATGQAKDLTGVLMAVDVLSVAKPATIHINPLTTIAAVKVGLSADTGAGTVTGADVAAKLAQIAQANTDTALAFGLGSATNLVRQAVQPTVNFDGSSNPNANAIGNILAAMSQMDANPGGSVTATINTLASGLSGNALATNVATDLVVAAAQVGVNAGSIAAAVAPSVNVSGFNPATDAASLTPLTASLLTQAQIQSLVAAGQLFNAPAEALLAINAQSLTAAFAAASPVMTLAGLTDAQLAMLSAAQLSALAGVNGQGLAALSFTQLGALSASQLNQLTGTQLTALAAADKFSGIYDIGALNATALASLSTQILGTLDSTQLVGLSATQIAAVAAAGKIGSFVDLSSFGSKIDSLSSAQVGALTSAQLTSLTASQIVTLATSNKLLGLSASQIAALGTDIATIGATNLANLSTTQLSGLNGFQIAALASQTPSGLSALNAAQIVALGTGIAALSAAQVVALDAQLAHLTSDQAAALAAGGSFANLTAPDIVRLSGSAIDSVPTDLITGLSAADVQALSDSQLNGLTQAQVAALAVANKLTALTAAKIAALGGDINGLTPAQVAALSDAQLAGLTKSQIAALATVNDLTQLVGAKLVAVGADINGLNATQTAQLSNAQLADLDATQLAALAADGDLASLSAAQIAAVGTDVSGLSSAQLGALSASQLSGLTDAQVSALATAGKMSTLTAANLLALSAEAIDRVPTDVIVRLGSQVSNLTLAQVQALTGAQIVALNNAGLLDDITQPLSSAQVTAATPTGLGLGGIDTADKLALFNDAIQSANGSTALDLAAMASAVGAVHAAVSGGTLTVAQLQTLGIAGVNGNNIASIARMVDDTSNASNASLVNSINELKAIVTNASGELIDQFINTAESSDGVTVAVALPAGATAGQVLALTLPGDGLTAAQTINHTLTQENLSAGVAMVSISSNQLNAAGNGEKSLTASIQGGPGFFVAKVTLDTVAPVVTNYAPLDESSILTIGDLSITFDTLIAKGNGNIRLVNDSDSTTTTIAVNDSQVAISGNTLVINPTADLIAGKSYHVEIDDGALVDLAGNPYAGISGATTWNFVAATHSTTLASIAGNNFVNASEAAAPITLSGVVSQLGGGSSAATAALLASDFTVTLVPRNGGSTVTLSNVNYNSGSGAWSVAVPANTLADAKTYDVTVSVNGSAGAASGLQIVAKTTFATDLSDPNAPSISGVQDDVGLITGNVSASGETDDTAPVVRVGLNGSNALAGDSVQLFDGSNAIGSAAVLSSVDIGLNYVDIPLTGLIHGTTYNLTARITDMAANVGAASVSYTVTIDTQAPTAPTVSAVTFSNDTKGTGAASAHGTTSDLNTSSAAQTISATLSTNLALGDTLWGSTNGGSTWVDITNRVSGTSVQWTGATLSGSNVVFQVRDRAGNPGAATGSANYILDTVAPTITSGATVNFQEGGTGVAYDAQTAEGDVGLFYTLSGADAGLFTINNTTGAVSFVSAPNFETPADSNADGTYALTVRATDLAGNFTDQAVSLRVTDYNPTSSQLFQLWLSDGAAGGTTATTTGALQTAMTESVQQRDFVTSDGSGNGSNALQQYINRVTGTDVVSKAEFDAGFTISGKAAAGAASTIRFYLDNDRTNGTNEIGTQLVHGTNGVTINYDNASGNYTVNFSAGSAALRQATHNTAGSGVHQLTVDTNGNGALNTGEASRLFLVASGTAQNTDTGLISQNYTVQDAVTRNVFVYYYGDPDGTNGVAWRTALDFGDSASVHNQVSTDRDGINTDRDYFRGNTATFPYSTAVSTGNTAAGAFINLSAQTWEFQMAYSSAYVAQSANVSRAGDHTLFNSNTSRLSSTSELMALYAANFDGSTVGALTPFTNGMVATGSGGDNLPTGWNNEWLDTAGSSAGGRLFIYMRSGSIEELNATTPLYAAVVL